MTDEAYLVHPKKSELDNDEVSSSTLYHSPCLTDVSMMLPLNSVVFALLVLCSSTLGQQWDRDDSWRMFPSNKKPPITTAATSHAMMSGMNTEYVTSFLTETIQITHVISEVECLTDPCAGCATVQIMGEDLTNNLMAVEAITEVFDKGTHIWGNGSCPASNAVHLTDYYVVPSNSEKILYTNIVYTICDEACWRAFIQFVGSPAFASIPHDIGPLPNDTVLYVSDCATGNRLSGGNLPGCDPIPDCLAQDCFAD
eukprot:CFRG8626T1